MRQLTAMGKKIMKNSLLLCAATALLLGINTRSPEAAPAWKCYKRHCYWTEGYTGPVEQFAAG
jgi:hypothetical protein